MEEVLSIIKQIQDNRTAQQEIDSELSEDNKSQTEGGEHNH
jgi:hypothetical protein